MIQWQINDVRYTLTWQLPAKTEQTTILTMANVTPRR
jgi:hypothetical protein